MAVYGDQATYPVMAGSAYRVLNHAIVDIGASGAATLTASDGGILTCAKTADGEYAVTFSVLPAVATSKAFVRASILKSATPTVSSVVTTAYSLSAGTWAFPTFLDLSGTPVEPASGDQILLEVVGSIA